ncbi:hypothetical protein PBY51_008657 [Eleginops maclovinus]|uniref:Uncharacterized protein n=1 Tax=Eleginops maclovinus TaxID=56733 RepID=A0AAN7ZWJ1_ELEMC|nr:hypothetical protein PBY51_008657 [Eleginops maclovinus]
MKFFMSAKGDVLHRRRKQKTPRRALGSARDPMLRSRHQMVESSGSSCATLIRTIRENEKKSPVFLRVPLSYAGDYSVCPSSHLPEEETPRRDSGSMVPSHPLHAALAAARMVPSARGLSAPSSSGFTNNQAEHQHPAQPKTRCSPALCLHCKMCRCCRVI